MARRIFSNRILERYKFKHEKELEGLKTKYSTELEMTKSELDKSRHLFYKYSDKQFELYNNLWKVLWDIKKQADSLWEKAQGPKLPRFAKSLQNVKDALYVNILIIDEAHFKRMLAIIEEFEQFKFGKQRLIELREVRVEQDVDEEGYSYKKTITNIQASDAQIEDVIMRNGSLKRKFDEEIMMLAQEFRTRISG